MRHPERLKHRTVNRIKHVNTYGLSIDLGDDNFYEGSGDWKAFTEAAEGSEEYEAALINLQLNFEGLQDEPQPADAFVSPTGTFSLESGVKIKRQGIQGITKQSYFVRDVQPRVGRQDQAPGHPGDHQ